MSVISCANLSHILRTVTNLPVVAKDLHLERLNLAIKPKFVHDISYTLGIQKTINWSDFRAEFKGKMKHYKDISVLHTHQGMNDQSHKAK